MSDSRFSKCQILKDNILIQNILISIGVHPVFRILYMILHKPTGIIFKNRKEAKIFFDTSRYRKIEKEKQEIVLIDNQYITVNKDLIRIPQSKSANMEALLLYYIRTKCNKECASAIGEKKMQEELNLSESTVEGYIGKLKEYKSILSIKTLNPNNEEDKKEIDKALGVPYEGDKRKKNLYYFHEPQRFYFLNPQFIYRTDIENEIKGFLIRLACLCDIGTTKIYTPICRKEKANIKSIAEELKMCREKVKSLLSRCENLGLIRAIPRGYIILEDSFLLNLNGTLEDRVYNSIYKYCLEKEVVPPNRYEFSSKGNPMECDGLLMCAPYIFDRWNIYNAKAVRCKEYPPLMFEAYINAILLPMRFPTLPEEPHWEYFKKVFLNINTKARKPQIVEMCINNESEYPFIAARSIYPEKLQKSAVWDCDD